MWFCHPGGPDHDLDADIPRPGDRPECVTLVDTEDHPVARDGLAEEVGCDLSDAGGAADLRRVEGPGPRW